jgi:hypothetical protein
MADSNHTPLPGEWLLLSEALKRKVDELRSSELAKRWLIMELDAKRIRFRFRAHDFVQHSGEDLSGLLWQAATVDWEQSSAVQAVPRRIMSLHMYESELMRENQRGSHGFPKVLNVNEPTEEEKIAERTFYAVEVFWTEPAVISAPAAAASPPAAEAQSSKTLIKSEVDRIVAAGERWESITAVSKSINERLKTKGVHLKPRTIENYLRKLKLWPFPTKK